MLQESVHNLLIINLFLYCKGTIVSINTYSTEIIYIYIYDINIININ